MAKESLDRLAQALQAMTDQPETGSESPNEIPQPDVTPLQSSSKPSQPVINRHSSPITTNTSPSPSQPAIKSRPARPDSVEIIRENTPTPLTSIPAYPKHSAGKTPKRKLRTGSLEFRRTLIPPCLVVGICFIIFMLFFFFQPEDAALRQVRWVVPVGMGIMGCLLLGIGVLNMLLVKKELDLRQNHRGGSRV